jgi:hypothetical protein
MARKNMVSKTSAKKASATFPTTGQGGKTVSVTPGKGGVTVGPKNCAGQRAHFYTH